MPYLSVPGANLYYETQGKGPLLVLVPAANGDTKLYEAILPYLAERFTACAYDRRRFSRSMQTEDHDYQGVERAKRDADDLELLVKHLQPDKPALIFGSSSGGIVALELMQRHPASVAGMIAHEAPLATVADPAIAQGLSGAIGEVIVDYQKTQDTKPVCDWFVSSFPDEEDRDCLSAYWADPSNQANLKFWIDRELMGWPGLPVDFETLKQNKARSAIGLSKEMEEALVGNVAHNLSEKTGAPLLTLPHAHMGYATHPKEYAAALIKEFDARWK